MNKHNIFYSGGSMITDVSGKKTKEQIANEFSWDLNSIQHIEVDASLESTKVVDGSIVKYNFIEANEQIAVEVEEKKEAKIANVKDKLSLSDEDWEDLKEALK
jgi:uncharacterized protein (UPF0179 family)